MRTMMLLALAASFIACGPKPTPPVEPFAERPEPSRPKAYTPPVADQYALENGLRVYVIAQPSLPLVSMRLHMPVGSASDPAGKAGLASLTGSMLGEGAGDRDTLAQAAALEELAASLQIGVRREATTLALDVHADRFKDALPLASDALLRPRMDTEEWERISAQHETLLKASLDDNRTVAGQVATRIFWGENHPYALPTDGTPQSVSTITLEDVVGFHRDHLHAGDASIVIVGDVDWSEVEPALNAEFGEWKSGERAGTEMPAAARPAGVYAVDRPGSTQTVFQVLMPGISSTEPRADLDIAATIMGGSFTSRLNRRLREELGYTYGASMRKGSMRQGGTVTVGSNIRADVTGEAYDELQTLLGTAASDPMSDAEVERGRAQVLSRVVDRVETRSGLAGVLLEELIAGRQLDAFSGYVQSVDGANVDSVSRAASGFVPGDAIIILVGDGKQVAAALAERKVKVNWVKETDLGLQ